MRKSIPFVFLFAVGTAIVAFDAALATAQETTGRKYAILVGVKEYDRNQLKNLPFAENDMAELADLLKQSGFRRVELLTQTEGAKKARALPLAKTIREAIHGVLEDRNKDDLVLIAFAGHGVQFKGEKENFFCPMDAVLTDRSTLISVSEVYDQLKQSKASVKLLLVDACRNDPLAGNARAAGDVELQSLTRPPDPPGGVAAFFSCSAGQRALEDEGLKHGVFFHHVILGLKGEARLTKRDEVTWDSLVAYVKAEVPDTVKDLFGNSTRQIPEHRGELRGDAMLIRLTGNYQTRGLPSLLPKAGTKIPSTSSNPNKAELPSSGSEMKKQTAQSNTTRRDFEGTKAGDRKELTSGINFRWCPAGTFTMGSPQSESGRDKDEDQVSVTLSNGYWLGETELTEGQYKMLMTNGSSKGSGYPVTNVSHDDAVSYCQKLTTQERSSNRLPKGWKYTLPTEAQWEFACRAESKTKYWFGDNESQLGEYAWYDKNSSSVNRVGEKPANKWGLWDMHGNVYEWCADWYGDKLTGGRDPQGPSSGSDRVNRGGGWGGIAVYCRSAYRRNYSPGAQYSNLGFRLAAVPE